MNWPEATYKICEWVALVAIIAFLAHCEARTNEAKAGIPPACNCSK